MISGPDTGGRTLYAVLELAPDADADAINKAYRRLSMLHHPDRKTGSVAEFQVVKFAYEVLSDPERRRQYDKSGISAERDRTAEAMRNIGAIIIQVIDKGDPDRNDVIQLAAEVIRLKQQEYHTNILELQTKVGKRQRALKRLKHKEPGVSFIAIAIEGDIAALSKQILELNDTIELGDVMDGLLKHHEYQVDLSNLELSVYSSILKRGHEDGGIPINFMFRGGL